MLVKSNSSDYSLTYFVDCRPLPAWVSLQLSFMGGMLPLPEEIHVVLGVFGVVAASSAKGSVKPMQSPVHSAKSMLGLNE